MAQFASTTLSGYSDPLRAQSIKALEKRQADLLAQQAAQKDDTALMATIPGGIGHVLGVVGDNMRQGRTDAALAAQKETLARTIAGMDPMNPKPQEMSVIATAAPEMWTHMLTQLAESRRQQAGFSNEAETQKRLFGHQDEAAAEAARVAASQAADTAAVQTERDRAKEREATIAAAQLAETQGKEKRTEEAAKEAAAVSAFDRNKTLPQTELEKLTQSLGRKPSEDEVKAAVAKLTARSPSEEKIINDERDKAVDLQSNLKLMDEAHGIINSPKGIHSGNAVTTPLKTGIGSFWPQSLGGPDDETQKNTQRFNLIMKSEGLQQLLKMKGASSDKDVQENFKIANDPSQPLDSRKIALSHMRDAVYTHVKRNAEDLRRMGGPYPTLERAPGSNTPDPNAAARKWLDDPANASNPDYENVRRKVEGK